MITDKQWLEFIKKELARVVLDVEKFINERYEKERLIEFRKNYIPLYGQRTEAEHARIRESLKRDPNKCSHLKGGDIRRGVMKDYNVTGHYFPNGILRIRCSICGKKWFKGDPDWSEAIRMVNQSTNSISSSEICNEFLSVAREQNPERAAVQSNKEI